MDVFNEVNIFGKLLGVHEMTLPLIWGGKGRKGEEGTATPKVKNLFVFAVFNKIPSRA